MILALFIPTPVVFATVVAICVVAYKLLMYGLTTNAKRKSDFVLAGILFCAAATVIVFEWLRQASGDLW